MSFEGSSDFFKVLVYASTGKDRVCSTEMIFRIADLCGGLRPESIPSLGDIIRRIETKGSYRFPKEQFLDRGDLRELKVLQRFMEGINTTEKRLRLGPAQEARRAP